MVNNENGPELAFVGLGGMGGGMARRLRAEGFPLVVWNRTAAKAAPLAAAGARIAADVAEVSSSSIIFLSLSDQAAVEDVLFSRLAPRLTAGTTVIDTSAVPGAYSIAARARLGELGVRRVEACVVGNPPMAAAGQLRIYTAGDPADVEPVRPVLSALAQEITHIGAAGSACALKLSFNLMLGNQVAALAEAMAYVESAGVDRDLFLNALTGSGFSSATLAFRAQMVKARRYEPAQFRSKLMAKDLGIILDEATAAGIEMPVTAKVSGLFRDVVEAGGGDQDAAVLAERGAAPVAI